MDILAFGTSLPGEGREYVRIRSDLTTVSPNGVTGVRMHGYSRLWDIAPRERGGIRSDSFGLDDRVP